MNVGILKVANGMLAEAHRAIPSGHAVIATKQCADLGMEEWLIEGPMMPPRVNGVGTPTVEIVCRVEQSADVKTIWAKWAHAPLREWQVN